MTVALQLCIFIALVSSAAGVDVVSSAAGVFALQQNSCFQNPAGAKLAAAMSAARHGCCTTCFLQKNIQALLNCLA